MAAAASIACPCASSRSLDTAWPDRLKDERDAPLLYLDFRPRGQTAAGRSSTPRSPGTSCVRATSQLMGKLKELRASSPPGAFFAGGGSATCIQFSTSHAPSGGAAPLAGTREAAQS